MIVNKQKPLSFLNTCATDYEPWQLEAAILREAQIKLVCRLKKIFLHGHYAAVSIYGRKIHIHRLLMSWHLKRPLQKHEYVHHKDSNKFNNRLSNLELNSPSEHQREANIGKKFTEEHRRKIGLANKKRLGMKYNKSLRKPRIT